MIINSTISKKIARFYQPVKKGPKKCPVYLKLAWIGNISLKFEKQVKSNLQNCFSAVKPCVIFHTRKIPPLIHKNAVPITQQSLVVHQYVCRCDGRYLGRTSLRLHKRIIEHIPKSIQNKKKPTKVLPWRNCKAKSPLYQLECNSAIGLHALTSKSWLRCPLSWSRIFNFGKSKNPISLSSARSYFYQNIETNFVPAERIRLLSSNFTISLTFVQLKLFTFFFFFLGGNFNVLKKYKRPIFQP